MMVIMDSIYISRGLVDEIIDQLNTRKVLQKNF